LKKIKLKRELQKKDKLLSPNFDNVFTSRSTIVKPICDKQITSKYVSWLNDKSINQFLEIRHEKQTKKSIIAYINYLREKPDCEMFSIFNKSEMNHIGNLTITSFNHNNNGAVDFGLMIADEYSRAKGVGAEVHLILLEFAFSFKNIIRINASAPSKNKVACRTLESIGYKKEGIRRNLFPLLSGDRCNLNDYGILRDEWYERKTNLQYLLKSIKV
tara:strand:- start:102 stop:749 length:648 start_codon:yes stop_codon:yes gene_type:complete